MRTPKQSIINKYHIHDSRKISSLFPSKPIVNVTITSPPYWDRRDYGAKKQIGFQQGYEEYLDDLESVFRAVHTVTADRGSLWVVTDTIKQNGELKLLPFDLASRLKRVGWILQDIIIWNKDRTLPWSHQGKLRNIFEYIAFYSKTPKFDYYLDRVRDIKDLREWWVRYPERYSPQGKAPTRTWTIPIPSQGSWGNNWVRHFCPFPPELIKRILTLTTAKGDLVFDPFSGSGAVLAQANIMGRKYIGLDLNPAYRRMFTKTVLPAIREMGRTLKADESKAAIQKQKFNRSIRALRKTKYAKELVRLYRREHGALKLDGVLTLRGSDSAAITIVFLFPKGKKIPAKFLTRAYALSLKAPLSKYGLTVELSACSVGSLSKLWFENRRINIDSHLYVYAGGRTYSWAKRMTARSVLSLNRAEGLASLVNGYPPLLSSIGINIRPQSVLSEQREGR